MRKSIPLLIALTVTLAPAAQTTAADLPDAHASYTYRGPQVQLRSTLQMFAENIGVPVVISDEVTARVDTSIPLMGRRDFLNKLASRYRFVWYFDGGVLYVASVSELTTSSIKLSNWSAHEIARELKAAGIWENRFIRIGAPLSQLLIVTAPPSFTKNLEKVVGEIDRTARRQAKVVAVIEEKPLMPELDSTLAKTEEAMSEISKTVE